MMNRNINSNLYELYSSKLSALTEMYSILDAENLPTGYAGPLFMHCQEEEYLSAKKKILIVGQETNGWYDGYLTNKTELDKCLTLYENFALGKNYSSFFWSYAHELVAEINGFCDQNFLWTNINKFGRDDAPGKPDARVLEEENSKLNIFAEEIKIVQPDICIFFTGPNYDGDIKAKLPDVSFEKCSELDARALARVVSSVLPATSFRTYHPGFLNRGNWGIWETVKKIIRTEI